MTPECCPYVDGIHMNGDGYDALARCLEPQIRAAMAGGRPAGRATRSPAPHGTGDEGA